MDTTFRPWPVTQGQTSGEINLLFILQVELVNIGAADIVDGNHKLILGLIWSIILHWQVCVFTHLLSALYNLCGL